MDKARGKVSAGPKTDKNEALTERDRIKISLLRNALYHDDRERFFATVHRCIMFFVVVGGTATIASVTQGWPILIAVLGLGVTILGTLDLVFGLDASARQHSVLRQRIYQLLSRAEDGSYPLSKLREEATLVYADEPPIMHAVNAVAYNTAMESWARPKEYFFNVGKWKRTFRHWRAFTANDFKTFAEEASSSKRGTA